MPKYKITASKSQKKYTFVISEENEKLAKKRIHDDGYSILSISLFDTLDTNKKSFVFRWEKNWEEKNWKVVWEDIFKIYLKLREELWYKVLSLYSSLDEEKDDIYKQNVLKELEEQYKYYDALNQKEEKKTKNKEEKQEEKTNIDSFYLKKELEETYKLIDFVLSKVNNLLWEDKYKLDEEKKIKLKNLYNSLIKIKSSTNISKLREVWESVLLKIWEIELWYLESTKDEKTLELLNETNKLLKQIWSEKKFIPDDKDIKKQAEKVLFWMKAFFKDLIKQNKKPKKEWVWSSDKTSHEYLKTIIFLNKYKQKLKQNNSQILKNIFVFILPWEKNISKKQDLIVRRRVIKQNIYLFKAKLEGKIFSYTRVIKGFDFFLDIIFRFFKNMRNYLFFVVLFYSLIFIIFTNLNYYWVNIIFEESLNYRWVFYFLVFSLIYFCIYFSRWVFSLILNFFILFITVFLWVVNF